MILFQLSLMIEKLKLQHQWTRKEKKKEGGEEMYKLNKGIKEQKWFVKHVMKLSHIMWICEVAQC